MKKTPAAKARRDDGAIETTLARGCLSAAIVRPARRNRITAAMGDQLLTLVEQAEDDQEIAMLAVTGAGNFFCGGFDDGVNSNLVESLAALSKPVLAIINGDAIDEGLELAMAADLRVVLTGAKLALTQAARGTMPRFGGTQRLPRLAGIANAMRLLLTGGAIDGEEAVRIGLATYGAHSRRELAETAGRVTEAILSRGPVALRMAKDAVRKGYDMTLDQGIRLEEDLYALLQTTADRAEGVRAFLEKRKPLFKGA